MAWSIGANRFCSLLDGFASFSPSFSIYSYDKYSSKATLLRTTNCSSKSLQASWGRLDQNIYACDEQGQITIYDAETGAQVAKKKLHKGSIQKFSFDNEKGLILTSSKDGTSKLIEYKSLEVIKTYETGRPVNCAVLSPIKKHVLLGGGESAETVTTSRLDTRQFRARFFHSVFENEIGSLAGHFGTMTSLAISPNGKMYIFLKIYLTLKKIGLLPVLKILMFAYIIWINYHRKFLNKMFLKRGFVFVFSTNSRIFLKFMGE